MKTNFSLWFFFSIVIKSKKSKYILYLLNSPQCNLMISDENKILKQNFSFYYTLVLFKKKVFYFLKKKNSITWLFNLKINVFFFYLVWKLIYHFNFKWIFILKKYILSYKLQGKVTSNRQRQQWKISKKKQS